MQTTTGPGDTRAGGHGSFDAANSWADKRLLVVAGDPAPLPAVPGIALLARLDWQSTRLAEAGEIADLVLADTRGLPDDELPARLERLASAAAGKLDRLLVAFARDQLDLVAEPFLCRGPVLLCEPDAVGLAAALGLAAAMRDEPSAWNEPRDDAERIRRLSGEVARLAGMLAELTAQDRGSGNGYVAAPTRGWEAGPDATATPPVSADEIRSVVRTRRLRDQLFGEGLFEDPAWDMLLDLYAAALEGRRVSVSSLCIAAAVAPTTALRWITRLTERRLLARMPDPRDRRRVFIGLTDEAVSAMHGHLAALTDARLPLA
jgi:DNA-binding MarR family transcriptional regulator